MRASSEIRASPQVRSISARPGWHQGGDVRETLARRPGAGTVAPRPVRNKKTFPNDGGVCRRGKIPPAGDTFRVTPIPCRVRSVQIHGPNRSTIHGLELALRDPGKGILDERWTAWSEELMHPVRFTAPCASGRGRYTCRPR